MYIEKNYHIQVKFADDTKTITIKKEDENGVGLAGARFEIAGKDADVSEYLGSLRMYAQDEYTQYEMVEQEDGTYVSNNHENNSSAVSYMDLDLRQLSGSYKFAVNASVSSEQGHDNGYVLIRKVKAKPATATSTSTSTSTSTGTSTGTSTSTASGEEEQGDEADGDEPSEMYVLKISGEVASKDYWTMLKGGNKYEVFFVYAKDEANSAGNDEFTINSVRLIKGGYDVTKVTGETNENGIVTIDVTGYGDYTIKEVQTPEHYMNNNETHEITIEPTVNEYNDTFVNKHKPYLIVHHYYKDAEGTLTTNKVAEDEVTEKNPEED